MKDYAAMKTDFHSKAKDFLATLCQDFDLDDICYFVDLKDISSHFPGDFDNSLYHRRLKTREAIFYSSTRLKTFTGHFNKLVRTDESAPASVYRSGDISWNYTPSMAINHKTRELLDTYQYTNREIITVNCPLIKEHIAKFMIMTNKVGVDKYINNHDLLIAMFKFHVRATKDYGPIVNPTLDYNIIKQSSMKILRLLVQGHSRKETARKCCITQRGVDYHIETLKIHFDANNMAQLVYKAKDIMLI